MKANHNITEISKPVAPISKTYVAAFRFEEAFQPDSQGKLRLFDIMNSMARQTVMPMANSLKVDCQATTDADFTVDRTSSPKMSENRTKRIERPRIGSGPEEIVCYVSTYGLGSIIQEKNYKANVQRGGTLPIRPR